MRHFSALVLIVLLPAIATANITVKREKPTVQRKTFDPAHPPADMPHLEPGEAAVTASMFRCQAKGTYQIVSRKSSDAGTTAVVYVSAIAYTLTLDIIIWTPEGCGEKLKAHEDGHRKLAEEIYNERATQAARTVGAAFDQHRLTGEGADLNAAMSAAINPPMTDLGANYMKLTADISNEINKTYDEITAHGLNPIAEDDAIHQAFSRYEHDHPTTRPARKKG
jgi:hypothetical protein